ncbi:MAG TPA: DUF5689 domain-containing protein, partial [Flavobacteriales bacterium]|nr:DUF5689 domain-containing protein [Flavobacteriales bacterium]
MSLPFRSLIGAIAAIALLAGCKKEFDSPPERTLPTGSVMTLAELRDLYTNSPVHFPASTPKSVYAIVTADEQDGNLYKNIYVQDHTAAIVLRLMNSGGLYVGDSIRIYLPGCVLSSYQSMLQLDSVNVDNNVVKQATGVIIQPRVATIADINSNISAWQGQLIKLENVEFALSDTGLTYADAVNQTSVNRNIEDCNGGAIIARNSGFSNYAAVHVPTGKGSLVATLGQFGSTPQLNLRSRAEVQMNGPRCGEGPTTCDPVSSLDENFDTVNNNATIDADQIPCWANSQTAGSRAWRGRADGSNMCAEAAPISFDASSIEWLITAPLT